MQKLKIDGILKLIKSGKIFEAESADGSFTIKINRYVPYVCLAVHDGSHVRESISEKLALTDFERWYEEDPFTGDFISSLPITIISNDSRYEYDLNRRPSECVYDIAWGKNVWKKKLTTKEKQISLSKHNNFYKVLKVLVAKLEGTFDGCLVYDIHSYNSKRINRETPLFNLGTENIDKKSFQPIVDDWLNKLSAIEIPGVVNVTAENDVFYGRGYVLEYLTKTFKNTLVLATEIKKVYCNEYTGTTFPEIIRSMQEEFKNAIVKNAHFYTKQHTQWNSKNAVNLLDKKDDLDLLKVDAELFRILKNFELLAYVNPINVRKEQRKFIKNNFTEEPVFKYSPIKIHPFELKQKLSLISTQSISDISIRYMYEDVINSYFDKIDLLSELDSTKFLYNSLRYFQRPSEKDIKNAYYLLHLPPIPNEPRREPFLQTDEVVELFKTGLASYGLESKIELSDRVIAQVMVLNSKKTVKIRPDARFTEKQVKALIEHEIGVHMVTTENSSIQPLKVFNIGMPVNTETQEGLAILSEILSGNISLDRLKKLALRVLITDKMCSGASFVESFKFLTDNNYVGVHDAFTIVTRVYRGGGFTKDYLYLSGLVKVLKFWRDGNDLSPLLVGKTSLNYYDLITEMIEREMLAKPRFITKSFLDPDRSQTEGIYGYILSGLK